MSRLESPACTDVSAGKRALQVVITHNNRGRGVTSLFLDTYINFTPPPTSPLKSTLYTHLYPAQTGCGL
jgi:hypothetical protein